MQEKLKIHEIRTRCYKQEIIQKKSQEIYHLINEFMLDRKIEQKKNEQCISLSCLNIAFLDKMLTKCVTSKRKKCQTKA